jgi:hypothetical protein
MPEFKHLLKAKPTPPQLPPVTPGCPPGWDLSKVPTDYLIAELVRRGGRYWGTPAPYAADNLNMELPTKRERRVKS